MLALGRLFANDYQDGTLEQMMLTPQPLYLVVLGKVLAQWLSSRRAFSPNRPDRGRSIRSVARYAWRAGSILLLGTPVLGLIGSIRSSS
jgi:heme exporter protein B